MIRCDERALVLASLEHFHNWRRLVSKVVFALLRSDFGEGFGDVGGYDFDKDKCELYNIAGDFSEANDLAAKEPQRLRDLQNLIKQAISNCVLPQKSTPSTIRTWGHTVMPQIRLLRPSGGVSGDGGRPVGPVSST